MDFFEFLNTAVTPYHTVDALKSFFKANSFTEIELGANLEPAKAYFVCREASIIAFRTPQKWSDESKFKIALAHTDFPTLKISPNPDVVNAGVCTLHTEVYGSPLYTSWLDRDLGYAGMLAYVDAGSSTLKTKLFRGEKLFRIPQLAVHLNRGVNQDGLKVNPQIDFNALWACASDNKASENRKNLFVKALEKELPEGSRLIDFDVQLYRGERELFESQIELARELNLPVIVHSRDAFEDTLDCIKNIGYNNGIIHCYSYGIDEARAFLDRGWYIALGGGITYTKKSKLEQMEALIRYIPTDRLLTETDAPYLAPVPFRGQPNTPVLVEHVFNYLSQVLSISIPALNLAVDENIARLFNL